MRHLRCLAGIPTQKQNPNNSLGGRWNRGSLGEGKKSQAHEGELGPNHNMAVDLDCGAAVGMSREAIVDLDCGAVAGLDHGAEGHDAAVDLDHGAMADLGCRVMTETMDCGAEVGLEVQRGNGQPL